MLTLFGLMKFWAGLGGEVIPDLFGGYVSSPINDDGNGVLGFIEITGYTTSEIEVNNSSLSEIVDTGSGVLCNIVENGGLVSEIIANNGVESTITDEGNSSISFINDDGTGIESLMS